MKKLEQGKNLSKAELAMAAPIKSDYVMGYPEEDRLRKLQEATELLE